MDNLPTNCIKLGDKIIDLTPQNEQDLTNITNTIINVMGFLLTIGTSAEKDDSKRVERVMTLSGNIGAAMAKSALMDIAQEKGMTAPKKEEHPHGNDA